MNYDSILSSRIQEVKPSGIRKFFDILEEMKDAVSLGIGEPDFVTPWHIRDAGIYSLEKGFTKYTSNAGMAELRREIASYLERRFQLRYDFASQIIVTVGGSEGIDLALRCMVDPGDEVIVPVPSFVCYGPLASMRGALRSMWRPRRKTSSALRPRSCAPPLPPGPRSWCCPSPTTPPAALWAGRTWRPSPKCCGARTSW